MPTTLSLSYLIDTNIILRYVDSNHQLYPTVYPEWRQLVTTFGVSGVQVHDARLVAIMRVNQISHLLSFNTKDFIRYSAAGITAVDPSQI